MDEYVSSRQLGSLIMGIGNADYSNTSGSHSLYTIDMFFNGYCPVSKGYAGRSHDGYSVLHRWLLPCVGPARDPAIEAFGCCST